MDPHLSTLVYNSFSPSLSSRSVFSLFFYYFLSVYLFLCLPDMGKCLEPFFFSFYMSPFFIITFLQRIFCNALFIFPLSTTTTEGCF
jgi:hypothetical protein